MARKKSTRHVEHRTRTHKAKAAPKAKANKKGQTTNKKKPTGKRPPKSTPKPSKVTVTVNGRTVHREG